MYSPLNKQFANAKGAANGLVRMANAALLAAYAVAVAKEDLPLGPLATIKREGKVPADYASRYRVPVAAD